MKAYRIYSGRKQDALELIEHTVSNPTVREVRVRVRAVSLNYRDLMIAWGQYPIASDPPPIAVADGAGEVIVMTAEGDVGIAVRAMKAGADDFIEKPFSDDLLLGAINTAFTRGRGPSRHREGRDAAKRVARLSPRERQVLDALVAGRLNKQIAHDLGISARTVEVHRARMQERLGTHSLGEAVRLAVMAALVPADVMPQTAHRRPGGSASRGPLK
jgi:DNA-binding CsgD family transcriptional regulator/CheY-like chemotaxis protein